jgi:hypothetical protein
MTIYNDSSCYFFRIPLIPIDKSSCFSLFPIPIIYIYHYIFIYIPLYIYTIIYIYIHHYIYILIYIYSSVYIPLYIHIPLYIYLFTIYQHIKLTTTIMTMTMMLSQSQGYPITGSRWPAGRGAVAWALVAPLCGA